MNKSAALGMDDEDVDKRQLRKSTTKGTFPVYQLFSLVRSLWSTGCSLAYSELNRLRAKEEEGEIWLDVGRMDAQSGRRLKNCNKTHQHYLCSGFLISTFNILMFVTDNFSNHRRVAAPETDAGR